MATGDLGVDEGSTKFLATYTFTEDAKTKHAGRSVLSDNTGAELKGQKAMAASVPVVLASDQAAIPVTVSGSATAAKQDTIIGHVDGIETAIASTNTKLDTVITNTDAALTDTELRATAVPVSVSGVSTAAKQDTIIGHVDGIETAIASTNTKLDTVITNTDAALTDTELRATPVPVSGTVTASNTTGNVANDAADSGNPVKIGGKAESSAPTAVTDGDRVDQKYTLFGESKNALTSAELNTSAALTSLRDLQIAQRYTVLGDSFSNGIDTFWSSSNGNGASAAAVTDSEVILDTGANATGYVQLTSTTVPYLPGQSAWLNSAVRFGDTGSAGNVRRIGSFTVNGSRVPQDGFYYELNSAGVDAVYVKIGTPTATAVASWSRAASAPFTLTTNAHSFEVRFTSYGVQFYCDNVLRHAVANGSTPPTATLNFPITLQNINSSGATSRVMAVRNIGMGRFGTEPRVRDFSGAPPKMASIAASSSGNNTIVAAVTGKKIRVLAAQLNANAAVNFKWQSGAGGTDLTGLNYSAANGGYVLPHNPDGWFETASATLLNLNLSAAIAVGGSITYIEV